MEKKKLGEVNEITPYKSENLLFNSTNLGVIDINAKTLETNLISSNESLGPSPLGQNQRFIIFDSSQSSYWISSHTNLLLDTFGLLAQRDSFPFVTDGLVIDNELLLISLSKIFKIKDGRITYESAFFPIETYGGFFFTKKIESGDIYISCGKGLLTLNKGHDLSFVHPNRIKYPTNKLLPYQGGVLTGTLDKGVLFVKKNQVQSTLNTSYLKLEKTGKYIRDLVLGKDSSVWILSGDAGISQISNQKNPETSNYDFKYLYPSPSFSTIEWKNDELWCGGSNGITVFPLRYFDQDSLAPRVHIKSIEVNGREVSSNSKLTLSPGLSSINASIQGFSSFKNPFLTYEVLQNGEPAYTWSGTGPMKISTLQMSPGKHLWEVNVYNSHGVKSNFPATISIEVTPYFYQRLWFICSIGGGMALIIMSIILLIKIRIRNKYSLIHDINELRHQALSAHLNPHFIFNSLNSVSSFVLKNNRVAANEYLSKFSRLIRSVLENSIEKMVPLNQELISLNNYIDLEQIRYPNRFEFYLKNDLAMEASNFLVPPLIFQQFVENSIHHGVIPSDNEKGIISLDISQNEYYLICEIQDNGQGWKEDIPARNKKNRSTKPLGISLTIQRLKLIEDLYDCPSQLQIINLSNQMGPECGTLIRFNLPMVERKR